MSYAIRWTAEALATFEERIHYLRIHWTQKEIVNFSERVKEYLEVIAKEPLIAKKGKIKNVHMGLIIKQVSLIYRVKPQKKEIELLSFIDNRQDPKKTKKYRP